jgi:hypothetical protein
MAEVEDYAQGRRVQAKRKTVSCLGMGESRSHLLKAERHMAFITRNAPEFLFLTVCSILLAGVVYLFLI